MRVSLAGGALLLAALAAALAGCASGSEVSGESRLTVYLSVPLSGSAGGEGQAAAAGARRALDQAGGEAGGVEVVLEELDAAVVVGASWDPAAAGANARRATQDSASIAYLGELESGATRASLPITNEAELLQIAPGSPAVDLVSPFEGSDEIPETQPTGLRTFGRVGEGPDPEELGYRAMAVALDGVDRADDPLSRGSVIEAFFATGEHDSVAGPYSVDELGEIEFP